MENPLVRLTWISIKTKLPPIDKKVLVWISVADSESLGYFNTAMLTGVSNSIKWNLSNANEEIDNITHWLDVSPPVDLIDEFKLSRIAQTYFSKYEVGDY